MEIKTTGSDATTVVEGVKWRTPKQWGDGIAVDIHVTRADGKRISDLDRDLLADALIDLLEARGYCAGGGFKLTTETEDDK